VQWCTYLLIYLLTQVAREVLSIKPAISPKRLKIERNSYTGFRLPPKCMTLNDLCARFKVIDSSNAAKTTKYSLIMTPTPCRVPGCIISVRRRPTYRHSCTCLFAYLLTYLHSWLGRMKPAISPKRLKVEWKLLLTAYIKSYTGFQLPPKCMTLNDLCERFKVIDCLNAAKMAKYNLVMTRTPCRVA